jgi:hypothetical protein
VDGQELDKYLGYIQTLIESVHGVNRTLTLILDALELILRTLEKSGNESAVAVSEGVKAFIVRHKLGIDYDTDELGGV